MTNFKIRKTGNDLSSIAYYNTYGGGAYNAFHPEYAPKSVNGTMSGVSYKDSKGNCTWYVFGRYQEVHGIRLPYAKRTGNAGQWAVDTSSPSVGAIVVFTDSGSGHVAFVEKIEGGNIIVSESAYSTRGNDFLFKYGRTVDEICRVWGMKVKGYINPPNASSSYDEVPTKLKWGVGNLLEFIVLYSSSESENLTPIKKVNHLWRGFGYVTQVRPNSINPYVVSLTKGGTPIGAVRQEHVFRVDAEDTLQGVQNASGEPDLNVFGQNVFRFSNISFTQIFKDKTGSERLPLEDGKGTVAWVHEWAQNPYEVWKNNKLWGYVRPENTK